ncbi:MAG: hypothetical protein ACOCRX_10580 [Candidatus Woesearchaeota archaeon]
MQRDKNGKTAKEVAESMVVNGKVKISLVRLSGSMLAEVDKITRTGRIYFKEQSNFKRKFICPRLSYGEWHWISGSWSIRKPDGYVESFDDTCQKYKIEA